MCLVRRSDAIRDLSRWAMLAAFFLIAPHAGAQSQATSHWTFNGSVRIRFEDWDFFRAQPADSSYAYGASQLRFSAARQFHSSEALFELEQPWLIGLPSNATAAAPQGQLGFGASYF